METWAIALTVFGYAMAGAATFGYLCSDTENQNVSAETVLFMSVIWPLALAIGFGGMVYGKLHKEPKEEP